MTNKQYLIGQIKKLLDRDDLEDSDRVKLLALLSKHVPQAPAPPSPSKPVKATKTVKSRPFQRPPWLDNEG